MNIVFEGVELNRVDGKATGKQLEVVGCCHQSVTVGMIMEEGNWLSVFIFFWFIEVLWLI